MTDLQNKLLEMLKWLDSFIRKNGLRYYICGGTMIGAARHQGFIPWDDDVDIFLPRKDYEKLCELLKKPVDHYVIETPREDNPDYLYAFAKFYDTNTTMVEVLKNSIKRGVYIDVFPLDGLGNSLGEAKRYYKKIDRRNMFLAARVCAIRKERAWYKNLAILFCRLIPSFLVDEHKLCMKIDRLNKARSYDDYRFVGLNVSTYRSKAIYDKTIFGTPTDYRFEDAVFWGPEKYEDYLNETYGDWKKLPPEEKRHSAHDFTEIDFNKSYLDKN